MLRFITSLLLLVAAVVAGWLSWLSFSGGTLAGCSGGGSDCATVWLSHWSRIFGVPVAFIGMLLYLSIALAAGLRWLRFSILGSVMILAGAAWFFIIQLFILHAWCWRCGLAHALACLGALLLLLSLPRKKEGQKTAIGPWVWLGLFGVMGFAGVQFFAPVQEGSRVFEFSDKASAKGSVELLSVNSDAQVVLYDGKFKLTPYVLPTLGGGNLFSSGVIAETPLLRENPDAIPVPLVVLTDWTCAHCRELYQRLEAWTKVPEIKQTESGEAGANAPLTPVDGAVPVSASRVLVVSLPAYRDEAGREVHRHMLLARQLDQTAYEKISQELLEGSLSPTPEDVSTRLQTLISKEKWQKMTPEVLKQVNDELDLAQAVLKENDGRVEVATLPQIISSAGILTGTPGVEALETFIDQARKGDRSLVSAAVVARHKNQSRIEFESVIVRAPVVKQGEMTHATFAFKNTGTEDLYILGIKTTCGCTAVEGWKQKVAPGDSGHFQVALQTDGLVGTVTKPFSVRSNAANTDNEDFSQLEIVTTVALPDEDPVELEKRPASIALSAHGLTFATVRQGSSIPPKKVDLTVLEKGIKFGEPKASPSSSSGVSLRVIPRSDSAEGTFWLEASISEAAKPGPLDATFTVPIVRSPGFSPNESLPQGAASAAANVPSGHAGQQADFFTFTVQGLLLSSEPVQLSHRELILRSGPLPAPVTQEFFLSVEKKTDADFSVQSFTWKNLPAGAAEPVVTFTSDVSDTTSQRWLIRAIFPQGFTAEGSPVLELKTNHPEQPLVRIPVNTIPVVTSGGVALSSRNPR